VAPVSRPTKKENNHVTQKTFVSFSRFARFNRRADRLGARSDRRNACQRFGGASGYSHDTNHIDVTARRNARLRFSAFSELSRDNLNVVSTESVRDTSLGQPSNTKWLASLAYQRPCHLEYHQRADML
jgi:hypothetical protein